MSSWHADGADSQVPTLPATPGVGQGALWAVETQSQDREQVPVPSVSPPKGGGGVPKVPEGSTPKGVGEILVLIIH